MCFHKRANYRCEHQIWGSLVAPCKQAHRHADSPTDWLPCVEKQAHPLHTLAVDDICARCRRLNVKIELLERDMDRLMARCDTVLDGFGDGAVAAKTAEAEKVRKETEYRERLEREGREREEREKREWEERVGREQQEKQKRDRERSERMDKDVEVAAQCMTRLLREARETLERSYTEVDSTEVSTDISTDTTTDNSVDNSTDNSTVVTDEDLSCGQLDLDSVGVTEFNATGNPTIVVGDMRRGAGLLRRRVVTKEPAGDGIASHGSQSRIPGLGAKAGEGTSGFQSRLPVLGKRTAIKTPNGSASASAANGTNRAATAKAPAIATTTGQIATRVPKVSGTSLAKAANRVRVKTQGKAPTQGSVE